MLCINTLKKNKIELQMNRLNKAMIPHILTVNLGYSSNIFVHDYHGTQQKYFTFNFNCQQNIKKYTIIFPYIHLNINNNNFEQKDTTM